MRQLNFLQLLVLVLLFSLNIFAQNGQSQPVNIDLVSEDDIVPGVLKALPDYEKIKEKAIYIENSDALKKALGSERSVLDLIDFKGGNDAATADYDAGKLLIVEFASPQVSFETDNQIKQHLSKKSPNPPVYYRRIGNYSVFLFDGKDEASANELLGKIRYQKTVKWLGTDPFYQNRVERNFVETTLQIFVGTIISIVTLIGLMLVLGTIAGIIYFKIRSRQRESMTAFSDAGGMIRLNLDELTPDISPDRLLKG